MSTKKQTAAAETRANVDDRESLEVMGGNALVAGLNEITDELGIGFSEKAVKLAKKAAASNARKNGWPWLVGRDDARESVHARELAAVEKERDAAKADAKRADEGKANAIAQAATHAANMESIYNKHLGEKDSEIRRLAGIIRTVRGVAKEEEVS